MLLWVVKRHDAKGRPLEGRDKEVFQGQAAKVQSRPRARKHCTIVQGANSPTTKCVGAVILALQHQLAKDKVRCRVPDVQKTSRPTTVPSETNKRRRRDQRDRTLYICPPSFGGHEAWVTQHPFWNSGQACVFLTSVFGLSVLGVCLGGVRERRIDGDLLLERFGLERFGDRDCWRRGAVLREREEKRC